MGQGRSDIVLTIAQLAKERIFPVRKKGWGIET
jgi:hypothetical protein